MPTGGSPPVGQGENDPRNLSRAAGARAAHAKCPPPPPVRLTLLSQHDYSRVKGGYRSAQDDPEGSGWPMKTQRWTSPGTAESSWCWRNCSYDGAVRGERNGYSISPSTFGEEGFGGRAGQTRL